MARRRAYKPLDPHAGRAAFARLGAVVVLLIAGCTGVSLEQAAPCITAAAVDAGTARGYSAVELERGREVFVGKCGECHTLQAPGGRTEQEWREILPRMARRARLDAGDARRVEAYLLAARDAWPGGAGKK